MYHFYILDEEHVIIQKAVVIVMGNKKTFGVF